MRLKLDENIPASGAARLAALGHDVHTVRDEGLGGRPDDDVWHAAQAEDRFLVTQDLDLSRRALGVVDAAGDCLARRPTRRLGQRLRRGRLGRLAHVAVNRLADHAIRELLEMCVELRR